MNTEEKRYKKFKEILAALYTIGVDYVLVGGYAVALHGSLRLTQDLDVFVRTTDENIEKLRKALRLVFSDISIEEITTAEITDYSVIRFISEDNISVDIIGNLGERFLIDDINYEDIEIDGSKIRVATLESLFRLKSNTCRPVDQEDLLYIKEMINRKSKKND